MKWTDEVKQALESATPGPWYSKQAYSNQWKIEANNGVGFIGKVLATVSTTQLEVGVPNGNESNNANLIANAPTWLSQLLQEREQMVEALKRERDDAMVWDGITVVNRINKLLEQVGELE